MRKPQGTTKGKEIQEMNATETIKDIITHKVVAMNYGLSADSFAPEVRERWLSELRGMLVCLKNIAGDDNFYCFNYNDKSVEFGYYDKASKWNVIA